MAFNFCSFIHSFRGKYIISQALTQHGAACTKYFRGGGLKTQEPSSVILGTDGLFEDTQLTAKWKLRTSVFTLSFACSLHLPHLSPAPFVPAPTPTPTLSLSTYILLKWRGRRERRRVGSQNLGSDCTESNLRTSQSPLRVLKLRVHLVFGF